MGVAQSNVLLTIMRPMMRLSVDSWEGTWLNGRKGKDRDAGVWWRMLLTEFLLQGPRVPSLSALRPQEHCPIQG